jgi:hypothetical protein
MPVDYFLIRSLPAGKSANLAERRQPTGRILFLIKPGGDVVPPQGTERDIYAPVLDMPGNESAPYRASSGKGKRSGKTESGA